MANTFIKRTAKDVGTNPIDIYTTGSGTRSTVIGINIANTSTSNIECDIILRDETSSEYFIVKGCPINRNSALAAMGGDQKLVMEPNNVLIIRTNKADSADVIVSALEITA
jgi:hypothetical protein